MTKRIAVIAALIATALVVSAAPLSQTDKASRPEVVIRAIAPDSEQAVMRDRLGGESLFRHRDVVVRITVESVTGMSPTLEQAVAECARLRSEVKSFTDNRDGTAKWECAK